MGVFVETKPSVLHLRLNLHFIHKIDGIHEKSCSPEETFSDLAPPCKVSQVLAGQLVKDKCHGKRHRVPHRSRPRGEVVDAV
jgi:hypothetical protein